MRLRSTRRSCIESLPTGTGLTSRRDFMSSRTATTPTSSSLMRARRHPLLSRWSSRTQARSTALAIRGRCSRAWRNACVTALVPANGIHLNLVGKIASAFDVDTAIQRLGLSGCVTRQAPVPHHESLRLLAASHVLVVIQPDTRLQVPVKLYEYVGLRRRILALAEDGAVARLVHDGGFGVVVSPTDVDGIAAALTDLYRLHITNVPAGVDDARVAQFDARYQSEIFAEILSGLVPRTTPGLVTRSVRLGGPRESG